VKNDKKGKKKKKVAGKKKTYARGSAIKCRWIYDQNVCVHNSRQKKKIRGGIRKRTAQQKNRFLKIREDPLGEREGGER